MAVYTNWCTPTTFNPPQSGKGAMRPRIKHFTNTDPVALEADYAAFVDSLAVAGLPWPALDSVHFEVYPKLTNPNRGDPIYHIALSYWLTG